ncbi:carbohydrate-binding module family 18 protein, partial [Plenodomus tracheiphilus IPT5]
NENQRCGPKYKGLSCARSKYGSCCSQYGWCGSTKDHCNAGCQSAFGTCTG